MMKKKVQNMLEMVSHCIVYTMSMSALGILYCIYNNAYTHIITP